MVAREFGICVAFALSLAGCGGGDPAVGIGCALLDEASIELGQGAEAFGPPEETIRLARGPQGGCHLDLAVRATGLPGARLTLDFTIVDAEAGERVLTSRLVARLEGEGTTCEAYGIRALLARPWELEDRRIVVTGTVTDTIERTFADTLETTVLWPEPVDGVERDALCGDRG